MGRLLVSSAASSVGAHSSGVRMAPWPCLGGELTQISRQLFCFVGTGRQGVKSSGRQSRESPASRSHAHSPLPSAGPQASHKESEEALQKRLDEVSRELCRAQSSHASLRADAEKAREQQQQMAGEGGRGPAPWGKNTWDPRLLHLSGDTRGCLGSGLGSGGLAVVAGYGRWARVEDAATRAAAGLLLPPAQ